MKRNSFLTKVLGLQHRYDKVVEMFEGMGHAGRLLDAATRHGKIAMKLKDRGFDVITADINPIDFPAHEIPLAVANLNDNLPFQDEVFDFVLCSNGIEYFEDPFSFVRECYRILKPEGKLLIETPNILNLKARLAHLLVGFYRFTDRPYDEVSDHLGGEHRMNLQTYYQLRFNLHRNGFHIVDVTTQEFSNKAMAFVPLFPFIYIATYRAYKKETRPLQKERNKEIFKHMMSADLLFGKQLYILADKDPDYRKGI